MCAGTPTINVRHRVGLLGKSAIRAAWLMSLVRIRLPVAVIVWAVNCSTFVSIGGKPWERVRLDLSPREFA